MLLRTRKRPPCSSTIDELSQSPIPDPLRSFVVKKASKIRFIFSAGIPTPRSAIVTRAAHSLRRRPKRQTEILIRIRPPAKDASIALRTRSEKTCLKIRETRANSFAAELMYCSATSGLSSEPCNRYTRFVMASKG